MLWIQYIYYSFILFYFILFSIHNITFITPISYNYSYFSYYYTNRVIWSFTNLSSCNSWCYHPLLRLACNLGYTFLIPCYVFHLSSYRLFFHLSLYIWSNQWSQSVWEPLDSILIVLCFLIYSSSNSMTDPKSFAVILYYWYLGGITQPLTEDKAQTTYYT